MSNNTQHPKRFGELSREEQNRAFEDAREDLVAASEEVALLLISQALELENLEAHRLN